ncbi:MAG: ATP synthase F0 subunit B [Calditerrivibrio sp.]|nr:ATP synthase F0 subunit B [Calditerrivibrio sp.]MCA1932674.1 ATP synthase F0 subunit B [Calditerrivibrio sp.]MCA1980354.1 ATP synthase F0 subunit B [Calditerrivibrio sp.]
MKKVAFLLFALLVPIFSIASGGGNDSGNLFMGFVWRSIVFVVFVYILIRFLKSPLLGALDKRSEDIKTAIDDAVKARQDAESELNEYKTKIASMNKELEEMKERAFKVAEAEKVKIINDAEQAVEKLRQFAESLIESDLMRAKDELKRYTFNLARKIAEEKLIAELDDAKHEAVVKDYIKKIGDLS